MSGAQSISTRRAYGVQRVCRVWHRARSSVSARRQATRSPALCRRRGPIGAAPDDVLVAHIRRVLEASPFHGEGYRKAWAKLRVAGMRTSKERVRRLMREHDLQAPPRAGHAHGPKAHDGTITTEAPDVMWGTDMTATVTVAEGAAFVFVAVDHCATACIGLHAAKRGTRFEALEPIRQGIRERFGGIGDGVARGLRLRHDHGSNYLADDFQQEVAFFGIESSPSFVREPEGNGVAERFIRTLKENLLWGRSFETIEELRLAWLAFKRTYNEQWMLEKYDYRSPAQVRRDLLGLDAAAEKRIPSNHCPRTLRRYRTAGIPDTSFAFWRLSGIVRGYSNAPQPNHRILWKTQAASRDPPRKPTYLALNGTVAMGRSHGHTAVTNDSNQTDGNFLFAGRLVPLGRKGNIVYARSLRPGEEDTGEGVHVKAGEQLVIPAGELIINSREVDAYYNPAGTGGYAPVANTVWTWYQIAPAPEELGFLYFFALARRTDAAHALWASAIQARDDAREAKGIPQRQGVLNALATAEMAVIALHRCFEMVYELVEKFSPGLQVPASVDKIRAPVRGIRHAFEHIDERAQGKINQQKTHPDALTIFNQPDFVNSSVLQYKTLTLNLETEVIAALLDCREFIMNAIDNR